MTERPERVQAAFDVFEGKPDTGPNAKALFEYILYLEKKVKALDESNNNLCRSLTGAYSRYD